MNLLFILDNLRSNCGANVGIILQLAEVWNRKGVKLSCIVRTDRYRELDPEKTRFFENIWTIYSDEDEKLIDLTDNDEWRSLSSRRKLLRVLGNPVTLSRYFDKKFCNSKKVRKLYSRKIKEVCSNNAFDAVIAVTEPFMIPLSLVESGISLNTYTIMMDSYSRNKKGSSLVIRHAIREENKVLDFNRNVFALDFVYDDMDYLTSPRRAKMVSFSIPRINTTAGEHTADNTTTDNTDTAEEAIDNTASEKINTHSIAKENTAPNNRCINFIYTGILQEDIRNPENMLALFSSLPENYILHIYGGGSDNIVAKYKALMQDRLVLHGWVGSEEIAQVVTDGDILVNLNNSKRNMLPSKLIEYIDTGKPILNIVKLRDCPSLKYMSKYPLCLNVFEDDILSMTNTAKTKADLEKFVAASLGRKLDHAYIEDAFKECTAQSVADLIINTIRSRGN